MLMSIFLLSASLIFSTSSNNVPINDCKNEDIDIVFMIDDKTQKDVIPKKQIENIVTFFWDIRKNATGTLRIAITGVLGSGIYMPFKHMNSCLSISQIKDTLNAVEYNNEVNRSNTFTWNKYGVENVRNVTIAFTNDRRVFEAYVHCKGQNLCPKNVHLLVIHSHEILKISKQVKLQWFYANFILTDSTDLIQDMKLVYLNLCGKCTSGWIQFDHKPLIISCYDITEEKEQLSSYEAELLCSERKSNLVSIESKEELFFIQEMLTSNLFNVNKTTQSMNYNIPLGLRLFRRGQRLKYQWSNGRPFLLAYYKLSKMFQHNRDHMCISMAVLNETINFDFIDKILFNHSCTSRFFNFIVCEYDLLRSWSSFEDLNNDETELNKSQEILVLNKTFAFDCEEDDQYVHYFQVCDGFRNCNNGLDENWCPVKRQDRPFSYEIIFDIDYLLHKLWLPGRFLDIFTFVYNVKNECLEKRCQSIQCLPIQWLKGYHCLLTEHEEAGFLCTDTTCWHTFQYVICGINEREDFRDVDHKLISECNLSNMSCTSEYTVLLAPKCIYLRGVSGYPLGCPGLSHLDNCEAFICPDDMVKCPHSYCIQVHYVGDNVMDCRYGEDESYLVQVKNIQLKQCLSDAFPGEIIKVCDGVSQCENLADELNCPSYCPDGFTCKDGVALYDGNLQNPLQDVSIKFDRNTRVIHILNVDLSIINLQLYFAPLILELKIVNSNIQNDTYFVEKYAKIYFDNTYKVDISQNKIKLLSNHTKLFKYFPNVLFINISHNFNLHTIEENSIQSTVLRSIDLSYTHISSLPPHILESRFLQFVNLRNTHVTSLHWLPHNLKLHKFDVSNTNISLQSLTTNIFNNAKITEKLLTDNYKLCCALILGPNTSPHVCTSPDDVLSSCGDLLADHIKRYLLWAVTFFSVTGNLAVLVYRVSLDRQILKRSYGVLVTNLCLSDLTMGFYLLLIASVDIYYRDVYVLYESSWRHSSLCKMAGFLSTLSSETSTFFVFLITVDRFMAIRFPFGDFRLSKISLISSVVLTWSICFIISLIPVLYPELGIFSSNGMCLGLPLTYNQEPGWIYSIKIFIFLNFIIFFLVATGQLAIYFSAKRDKTTLGRSTARRKQEVDIAVQLCLIAVSNFLCWFPVCVIGLCSMAGFVVSLETYSWILVFVLPLNSAVNPNIYTIPFIYRKWKEFKQGNTNRR